VAKAEVLPVTAAVVAVIIRRDRVARLATAEGAVVTTLLRPAEVPILQRRVPPAPEGTPVDRIPPTVTREVLQDPIPPTRTRAPFLLPRRIPRAIRARQLRTIPRVPTCE
jgi:hypothetical protein